MKNLKLKSARAELDMSQAELAVGVTRQTINQIESGEYNPSIKLCISICKALNKTLDQIFWTDTTQILPKKEITKNRIMN